MATLAPFPGFGVTQYEVDARLSFTVVKGVAITLAFASKEELARWAKIKLPDSSELRKKCEEMSTERIGTNYEFEGGG